LESTAYAGMDDVVKTIPARVGESVRQGDIIVPFSADNRILRQAALTYENTRRVISPRKGLFLRETWKYYKNPHGW